MHSRCGSRRNQMGMNLSWDRIASRERAMTSRIVTCGLAGVLLGAGLAQTTAWAQDQPPPLEPPALVPPATKPATAPAPAPPAAPSRATPTKPAENRSLLVIPGVTAPVPPRTKAADSATRTPSTTTGSPKPTRTVQSLPRPAPSPPVSIPLTLESIPDDPPAEMGAERLPAGRSE